MVDFGLFSILHDKGIINLNIYSTLMCMVIVLFLGKAITNKSKFLRHYDIPEPVTGGVIVAIVLLLLNIYSGYSVKFDTKIQEPLMIIFFTTVGIGSDFKTIVKYAKLFLTFGLAVFLLLIVQNVVGVGIMSIIGENPLLGLLGGSITLSGGHGNGGAWGGEFIKYYNYPQAIDIAMACATYGLVSGGLIGGPMANYLVKKFNLKSTDTIQTSSESKAQNIQTTLQKSITSESLLASFSFVVVSIFIGMVVFWLTKGTKLALPSFVWCLFAGMILRNALGYRGLYKLEGKDNGIIGNVSLALFLAIAIMSLNLIELAKLALPISILLVIQTFAMIVFARYVTFNLCGRDYNAACMVSGHIGFGLGATPTAIANLQAVTNHFGPSKISFLIIPIMGGFFINIANSLVISFFLKLPSIEILKVVP